MTTNTPFPGKVGYLLKTYPKVSETFIMGEILGLERNALPLHIFSLYAPSDRVFHSATDSVKAPVSYVTTARASNALRILKAHATLLLGNPRRYFQALGFVMRRAEPNRASEFVQAGCLVAKLREVGVVHLHAHFASEPAGVAELVERLADIPYSISAHAKDIYLSPRESLRRKIDGARFTITCTEYNRRYLASLAAPDAPVYRMYHGLDLDHFYSQGAPAPSPPGHTPPLLLSVGRLREKKGFTVLIEACDRLRDMGLRLRCQIVGYGPDYDRLQRLIEASDLEDVVELVGKLTHETLIERYREAALFVLPCLIAGDGDRDGIPNVLLEAMAMRLPVISTDVSGIPEAVKHDNNGLLVPPNNAGALTNAIRTLLKQPERCRSLGEAGRQTVSSMFSVDTNLRQVRTLLADALVAAPRSTTSAVAGERVYVL